MVDNVPVASRVDPQEGILRTRSMAPTRRVHGSVRVRDITIGRPRARGVRRGEHFQRRLGHNVKRAFEVDGCGVRKKIVFVLFFLLKTNEA